MFLSVDAAEGAVVILHDVLERFKAGAALRRLAVRAHAIDFGNARLSILLLQMRMYLLVAERVAKADDHGF